MQRILGFILICISAVSFGALPIFARFAYADGITPITLLFLRFTTASAIMLVIMAARRIPFPRGRVLAGLVAMGALGYVGQSFCYFTALTLASASTVALLLYLYPVLVAILAAVLLKEKMTPVKIFSLALALSGAALTVGSVGGGQPGGILFGLGAAAIYSVYIVSGTQLMKLVPAIPASTVIILSAAFVYGLLTAARGAAWPVSLNGWLAIAGIALVSTVVAIVTFFAGLERIGPTNASTLSILEPVVTVLMASALLGEQLSGLQLAGGVLILAAVVVLTRGELKRPEAPA